MGRGQLRIYLGAAPGVGKTYSMLQEGKRRAERGADVVIGLVETHGRAHTALEVGGLETIPRKIVQYRGSVIDEMDLDAILARRPAVCLVDELAHTNAPGGRHRKRWEDVEALREAGIEVISTVNIQQFESLHDVVERITGSPQHEIIPDTVVHSADQVHFVDQTPEALRRRMAHGNIYAADQVDAALANYFRVGNLAALRELALMWVADQVDESLQGYRERYGISEAWETRERVVVALTGAPSGDQVIRRAARIASRLRGDLLGVRVRPTDGLITAPTASLETQKQLLAALGGTYRELASGDISKALIDVARASNATQIVLGSSRRSRWTELMQGSVINEVIRRSGSIDIHIVSTSTAPDAPATRPWMLRSQHIDPLSRRRRTVAWLLAVAIPITVNVILRLFGTQLGLGTDLLLFLTGCVVVATIGGLLPALLAAVASSLLINWFLTPPLHTLSIAQPEDVLGLVVFVLVVAVVGMMVSRAALKSAEAARARGDAESLAAVAAMSNAVDDPVPAMLGQIRQALGAKGVSLLERDASGIWSVKVGDGTDLPATPDEAACWAAIDEASGIALSGDDLTELDLDVLRSFCSQISTVVHQQQLRRDAAGAQQLAEVDNLRAALLAAVSHDLRTPLAAIKASVSSLRQDDLDWPDEVRDEFLETIEHQTDRLTELVSNLLGMSRIQAGAVQLNRRAVGVDEVVTAAISGLDLGGIVVDIDIGAMLPSWNVDPDLVERVIANLVDNAVKWSPPRRPVRVSAAATGTDITLLVVDHGPGIPRSRREQVFEPFQRLGDGAIGGTGLGLAVALGLTHVLGGTLDIDDTPGGGTTMVLRLPTFVGVTRSGRCAPDDNP